MFAEQLLLVGSALGVGLLGSLHCAGMCGPLAVAVGAAGGARPLLSLSLWVTGKALTYAILGVVAGTVGAAFGSPGLGTRPMAVLALSAGVLMILLGSRSLWRQARPGSGQGGPLGVLLAAVLSRKGPWVPLAAGLLTGLLPCGLVYAMTAQSLSVASPLWGAAIMLAFGLGTAPSLLGAGMLSGLLRSRTRRLGEIVAALAVVFMGSTVAWRGAQMLMTHASTASRH